jgi:hypothetical protein
MQDIRVPLPSPGEPQDKPRCVAFTRRSTSKGWQRSRPQSWTRENIVQMPRDIQEKKCPFQYEEALIRMGRSAYKFLQMINTISLWTDNWVIETLRLAHSGHFVAEKYIMTLFGSAPAPASSAVPAGALPNTSKVERLHIVACKHVRRWSAALPGGGGAGGATKPSSGDFSCPPKYNLYTLWLLVTM